MPLQPHLLVLIGALLVLLTAVLSGGLVFARRAVLLPCRGLAIASFLSSGLLGRLLGHRLVHHRSLLF
jgi:hypothetical protein